MITSSNLTSVLLVLSLLLLLLLLSLLSSSSSSFVSVVYNMKRHRHAARRFAARVRRGDFD